MTQRGSFAGIITDEHVDCHRGQPVLVVDGRAYGPDAVHPVYGMIGNVRMSADRGQASQEAGDAISHFYQPLSVG
jgi:hypothetical protein